MNFGDAQSAMKNGSKVTRPILPYVIFIQTDTDGKFCLMLNEPGSHEPRMWRPTEEDLFATDWLVIADI